MTRDAVERRGSQRIQTRQALTQRFWLSWYGGRSALQDLSVEGFALPARTPPASERPFEFLLEHEGRAGSIGGLAEVVNFLATADGVLVGCRFVGLDEEARSRIAEWLAEHVEGVAAVPVTSEDAQTIVLGPSII